MGPSKASELIPDTGRVLVAFSGGPDSVCLAHLLQRDIDPDRLMCLHIDHGLDPGSGARAERAQRIATQLGLPCHVDPLNLEVAGNVEANARQARYQALERHMQPGDTLVTAHHANDVAETLLLRLLRSASTAGLGGIRATQPFGPGQLIRPLLSWSKTDICAHLNDHNLPSIEDPTNDELSLDRNYIRAHVMPSLVERFPSAVASLNQSADFNQHITHTLASYLQQDLARQLETPFCLNIQNWQNLSAFHQAELIRQWCTDMRLPTPPGKRLVAFVEQVQTAKPDRCPHLHWDHASMYLYQRRLWLEPGPLDDRAHLDHYRLSWDGHTTLTLPEPLGELNLSSQSRQRLAATASEPLTLTVHSGRPGETIALGPRAELRNIRSLMSSAQVPPWRRDWWPRVWLNDQLLACGDRWQSPCLQDGLSWRCSHHLVT